MNANDYPLPGFRYAVDFREQMLASSSVGAEVSLCRGARWISG